MAKVLLETNDLDVTLVFQNEDESSSSFQEGLWADRENLRRILHEHTQRPQNAGRLWVSVLKIEDGWEVAWAERCASGAARGTQPLSWNDCREEVVGVLDRAGITVR
jgi:hypothetical protein